MKGWKPKPCGCVNARLPRAGRVTIRCEKHRGKVAKRGRVLAHFEEGQVRRG